MVRLTGLLSPHRGPRNPKRLLTIILPVLLCTSLVLAILASPAITAPALSGHAEVDALWYGSGPEGPIGGTSRVYIDTSPNERSGPRVGFFEEFAGGTGEMWRASGWMASVLTALTLNEDLTQHKIAFDVGGRVDGPSAGGLMTVGLMAALLGHTVAPDAAMTGIINPDGTIGPVGGIPHKVDGAAQAGKKLVLIPFGQRYDYDETQKALVDVVARGREKGVVVREVADVYQAYKLLTGQTLPRSRPDYVEAPSLSETGYKILTDTTMKWFKRYEESLQWYQKLAENEKKALAETVQLAENQYGKAVSALRQGVPAVAFDRIGGALVYMEQAKKAIEIQQGAQKQGLAGIDAVFGQLGQVSQRLDKTFKKLDETPVASLGDISILSDAYTMAMQAYGMIMLADTRHGEAKGIAARLQEQRQAPAESPQSQPQGSVLGVEVKPSGYNIGVTVVSVAPGSAAAKAGIRPGDILAAWNEEWITNSETLLKFIGATPPGSAVEIGLLRGNEELYLQVVMAGTAPVPAASPATSDDIAKETQLYLAKVSEATDFYILADLNLDLVEDRLQLLTGSSSGILPDPAQVGRLARLFEIAANANLNYFERIVLAGQAEEADRSLASYRWQFMSWDPYYAVAYATHMALSNRPSDSLFSILGASSYLYYATAALVAKYYSLEAQLDEKGRVAEVRQEKALINMLDTARERAAENIQLATDAGVDPVIPTGYYQLGAFLREGTLDDKLTALVSLWYASSQANILAYLGSGAAPKLPIGKKTR